MEKEDGMHRPTRECFFRRLVLRGDGKAVLLTLAVAALVVAGAPSVAWSGGGGERGRSPDAGRPAPSAKAPEAGRPEAGDTESLAALEAELLRTVSVAATGSGTARASNALCEKIVARAGKDALPILAKASGKAKAYSLGGRCTELLMSLGLEGGSVDGEISSLLYGMDTAGWAIEFLVAEGSKALPYLERVLRGPSRDPDATLKYTALVVVCRLGPKARGLKSVIQDLAKSKDEMIADKARDALKALSSHKKAAPEDE